MDPRNYPLLWLYLGLTIVTWLMTLLLLKRYLEKRKKLALYLSVSFILIASAITMLFFGMLETYITTYKKEWYRFSLAFAYCVIMIALSFQILFFGEIYGVSMNILKKYIIICIIIAIALALPNNYYGIPDEEEIGFGPNIRPLTSISMMLFAIIVFSRMANKSFNTAKRMEEKIPRLGFNMIGLSELAIVFLFSCFALDTVVFTLFDTGSYTIFVYIGWAFAAVYFLSSYLGLILPSQLAKKE
jgi:hypothetical protein